MGLTKPTTPGLWKVYLGSNGLTKLPQVAASTVSEGSKTTYQDLYIDFSTFKLPQARSIQIICDVAAFSDPQTTLTIPEGGVVVIHARVVTADAPLSLNIKGQGSASSAFSMFASSLDQAVTVTAADKTQKLSIGQGTLNSGVQLAIKPASNEVTTTWQKYPPIVFDQKSQNALFLSTQLRIATVLFWIDPTVATSIALHVISRTVRSPALIATNLQANALYKQLIAISNAGPGTVYAPVLSLSSYQSVLDRVIDLANDYQAQYNRFTDKAAAVGDQQAAWSAMAKHAKEASDFQDQLATDAYAKYVASKSVLLQAVYGFRSTQDELNIAASAFKLGIEEWKEKKQVEAAFTIIFAVITFAAAVGGALIGLPTEGAVAAAPTQIAGSVNAVKDVSALATALAQLTNKDTMTSLGKLVEGSAKLFASTTQIVDQMRVLQANPSQGFDFGTSTLSTDFSDLTAIQADAAWNAWTLDSDEAMQWAVDQKIGGASAYRLALRKHAVAGKLVSQAQAQVVRLGEEYDKLVLALLVANADAQRLQALQDKFAGEQAAALEAQRLFFDRLLQIRTGILIQLRNVTWAYKYFTLRDSRVSLDPMKDDILSFKNDATNVVLEVQSYQDSMSSDFSPYSKTFNSNQFGLDIGPALIANLKSKSEASFTLSPPIPIASITTTGALPTVVGPFATGSHFRTSGMRAFLEGVKSTSGTVSLQIATSGIYKDIDVNQNVFTFTTLPLARRLEYSYNPDGTLIDPPTIDSIIPSTVRVDPTPFATWIIRILNREELDLSGLTNIRLLWKGSASF